MSNDNTKVKRMAYLIYTDWDLSRHRQITQQTIADIFHVSAATISLWVADVAKETPQIQDELVYLKNLILQLEAYRVINLPALK
ncbi:hypothetical protein [Evtepia sp.]|uniref:hypothetical protein n=1 Tax=Evtepia sp. TaxID=2773933 RepID=UPI002E7A99F7|nr:hypothetical protein [Evtepia sp.]MEE0256577.1 hypothetical protein [Evtepia sp.]